MPATVWILNPSYRDGPHQLLRMGWVTHIEQNDDGQVVVHGSGGNKFFPVRMSKKAEVPTDFGLQLLQALDRARRAAAELDSDRVVAARRGEAGWSWEVYAPDEVPPAQNEPPAPPTTPPAGWQPPAPFQAPMDGPNGSFVPNPQGGMPRWVSKDQAQPEADALTD
ncbi:hypothetical protein ACFV6G_34135 [Streptomyces lavendulae]|uniref:hypothetical protein n=1 Tax=Streptomyces lavendulae TaxID=1914 RepID=UPI0036CFD6DE